MATKDFRASQVELSKLIASGGIGKKIGLAIYSGSIASNRSGSVTDSAIFNDVGNDVFLFVSGTVSNADFNRSNVSLFGGDVVISGTLYAERQVIEVDGVVDGDMIVTGSLFVEPDANSTKSVAFRRANGVDVFVVDSTNSHVEVTGRMGIGDNSPDAILDVQGGAGSAVPTLIIDHDDADVLGVDINLANTTATGIDIDALNTTGNVIDVGVTALTTGKALRIDHNDSATTAVTPTSIHVDFDKTGNAANSVTQEFKGMHIDMSDAASSNHAGSTVSMTGLDIGVDSANTNGTNSNTGLSITVTDATTNDGISIKAEDGAGSDIKMMSTANNSDFATIAVGANGATTITTVDGSDEAANLSFAIDGAIDIQSHGAITVDSSNSTIGIGTDAINQAINIGTGGNRSVNIGKSGGTSTVSIYSKGGTLELDATGQEVNIDSAAFDVNASGAITVNGDTTMEMVSAGASKFKSLDTTIIESGKTGAAALLLSSSHAAGGIKIEAGTGNLEVNSDGTFDVNSTGAITIDGSSTLSLDAADSTNLTMAVNVASTKTMTISATNANGSNVSNIDIDADGALTLNGAGGATFGDDTEAIVYDGSGNVNFDAVALDLDATGAITIDGSSTFSIDGVGTSNVTTNGALTVSGSTGLNLHSHGGEIDITSTVAAVDVNAAGSITLNGGSVIVNGVNADADFRVESVNKAGMLILDAATDQILFNNSPASRFAADEAFGGSAKGGLGTDTGVYISGSRGSIGSANSKGVTTIVGDLVVSGNIFHNNLGNANNIFLEANQIATNKIVSNDPAAPFAQGRDTDTYIEFGGDQIDFYAGGVKMLTFDEAGTDHITFNDGGLDVNFRVETNNLAAAIHADGGTDQVVIGGNTATITNYLMGTDTNILLSGTIGSMTTSTKGTVVASGDMVVSGTFHNPGIVHVHAFASANQNNIAVGSLVQVQFGGETADTHSAFASHQFTAPMAGHYLVNTAVMMHQIDISADGYQLYLSGTNLTPSALLLDSFAPAERFPAGDTSAGGGSTAPNTLKGSSIVYMPRNAVLSVFVLQQNGAQQTDLPRTAGVSGLGADGSNLSITKIS